MTSGRLRLLVFCLFALRGGVEAQVLNQGPPSPKRAPGATSVSSSSPQPPTPTFRSSGRLVVLNVVVSDGDGKPVTGLKKEDFSVLEDGKAESLQVFESHVPARQLAAIPDLHLGANEFTNFPKQAANTAVKPCIQSNFAGG